MNDFLQCAHAPPKNRNTKKRRPKRASLWYWIRGIVRSRTTLLSLLVCWTRTKHIFQFTNTSRVSQKKVPYRNTCTRFCNCFCFVILILLFLGQPVDCGNLAIWILTNRFPLAFSLSWLFLMWRDIPSIWNMYFISNCGNNLDLDQKVLSGIFT